MLIFKAAGSIFLGEIAEFEARSSRLKTRFFISFFIYITKLENNFFFSFFPVNNRNYKENYEILYYKVFKFYTINNHRIFEVYGFDKYGKYGQILRAYTSITCIKKLLLLKACSFYPIPLGCPYMPVKRLQKMIRYFSCYLN